MAENNNILYISIGNKIKELRKLKGIGQEDLSNQISLSRSSISNIETGKHQPSISLIYEICIALDCKINDLLPSIEDFITSKYSIKDEYNDILNSLNMDISKNNLIILKEILSKDDK